MNLSKPCKFLFICSFPPRCWEDINSRFNMYEEVSAKHTKPFLEPFRMMGLRLGNGGVKMKTKSQDILCFVGVWRWRVSGDQDNLECLQWRQKPKIIPLINVFFHPGCLAEHSHRLKCHCFESIETLVAIRRKHIRATEQDDLVSVDIIHEQSVSHSYHPMLSYNLEFQVSITVANPSNPSNPSKTQCENFRLIFT